MIATGEVVVSDTELAQIKYQERSEERERSLPSLQNNNGELMQSL